MRALTQDRGEHITEWFGLGPDVKGRCDACLKDRDLIAQHEPTDRWVCRHCFRKELVAREKDL